MAQLLLITEKSLSAKDNRQVGDVVGIYDDRHVFSKAEQDMFEVVKVSGSRETLQSAASPEVREATRAQTTDWTLDEPERAEVWKDGNDYKQIKTRPRLPLRYEDGQLKENYSRHLDNHEVLISTKSEVRE